MSLDISLTKSGRNYSEQRSYSYPSTVEQLDCLWHAIDDGVFGEDAKAIRFYTEIKAVKDANPKS